MAADEALVPVGHMTQGHDTTVDPAGVAAFADVLYAWLADNLVDAEVIEGDGSPGHPVRMQATYKPEAGVPVPVMVTFGRRAST